MRKSYPLNEFKALESIFRTTLKMEGEVVRVDSFSS